MRRRGKESPLLTIEKSFSSEEILEARACIKTSMTINSSINHQNLIRTAATFAAGLLCSPNREVIELAKKIASKWMIALKLTNQGRIRQRVVLSCILS